MHYLQYHITVSFQVNAARINKNLKTYIHIILNVQLLSNKKKIIIIYYKYQKTPIVNNIK